MYFRKPDVLFVLILFVSLGLVLTTVAAHAAPAPIESKDAAAGKSSDCQTQLVAFLCHPALENIHWSHVHGFGPDFDLASGSYVGYRTAVLEPVPFRYTLFNGFRLKLTDKAAVFGYQGVNVGVSVESTRETGMNYRLSPAFFFSLDDRW